MGKSIGRMRRRKGADAEREVADMIRPVYPSARRRWTSEESGKVRLGADIANTPGVCIQVQCAGQLTPETKLCEAVSAATESEIPVAFLCKRRSNRRGSEWFVAMRPGDFLALMMLWRERQ